MYSEVTLVRVRRPKNSQIEQDQHPQCEVISDNG